MKTFKKIVHFEKYLLKNASHVTSPMRHVELESFVSKLKLLHYI